MKRHIAIEAGDPVLKFSDCIILTLQPHNIQFVLSKCMANIVVCFRLQSLGFHQGIELIRQNFENFLCSAIHNFIRHHHASALLVLLIAASPATTSLAPLSLIPRHHVFIANMKLASQFILTCVFLHLYSARGPPARGPPARNRTAGISLGEPIPSPRVAIETRTIVRLTHQFRRDCRLVQPADNSETSSYVRQMIGQDSQETSA